MKKGSFLIYFLLIIILISCSNNSIQETLVIELTDMWTSDLIGNNSQAITGIYNDMLYLWGEDNSNYYLKFYTLEGQEKEKVIFNKGKGPGEILFARKGLVSNDCIYVYDHLLNRFNVYLFNGDLCKTLNVEESIDIDDFLVVDDYIYTHGTKKVKLAKIDINSGNIIKIKTYKRESDLRNDKYEYLGGRLSHNANTQRIYLGLSNKPFKIESYDYELNLKKTYANKLYKNLKPYIWEKVHDFNIPVGYNLIPSLISHGDKLYLSSPNGIDFVNNKFERLSVSNSIVVINTNTNSIYKLTNSVLSGFKEGFYVIGVTEDLIILLGFGESYQAYAKAHGYECNNGTVVMVFSIQNLRK